MRKSKRGRKSTQVAALCCLGIVVVLLSGCRTKCPIPYVNTKKYKLPKRPIVLHVSPTKYKMPDINAIFDYPKVKIDSSDDKFILGRKKIAIINPDPKDINARIFTDIFYLNLKKKGVDILERDTVDSIVRENRMVKNGEMQLTEREIQASINQLKKADYVFVPTVGKVKTDKILIDEGYWYGVFNQKTYNKEIAAANKAISEYNNKLYPILKLMLLPYNAEVRLHNFAVLYNAIKNDKFMRLIHKTPNVSNIPRSSLSPEDIVRNLINSRANGLPWYFNSLFPPKASLLGIDSISFEAYEAQKDLERYSALADGVRGTANARIYDYNIVIAKERLKRAREMQKFMEEEKGAGLSAADFKTMKVDGIKQLVLKASARVRYGINEKGGQKIQTIIIPIVDGYNRQVDYYNNYLNQAGITNKLVRAYSIPALIPLKKQEVLSKKMGSKRVYTHTNVGMTMRIINAKSSEVMWIVESSRDRQSTNSAINAICKTILDQISKK